MNLGVLVTLWALEGHLEAQVHVIHSCVVSTARSYPFQYILAYFPCCHTSLHNINISSSRLHPHVDGHNHQVKILFDLFYYGSTRGRHSPY